MSIDTNTLAGEVPDLLEELRYYARHFQPAIEDDNNYYRGDCRIDGKDAASLGEICRDAADLIDRLLAERDLDALLNKLGSGPLTLTT